MITEPLVLYKLMILTMLRQANLPMSNEQISDFFLSKEYTSYINLQKAIGELLDAHLIVSTAIRAGTRYEITREGEETLSFFGNDISEAIRADIDNFLRDNSIRLRNEMGIVSDYRREKDEYIIDCEIREAHSSLMKLSVSVPTEEHARMICDRWQANSQDVYATVMALLMRE